MGKSQPFPEEKLIIGILYSERELLNIVKSELEVRFGLIDYESEHLGFAYTDYYAAEMGTGLIKVFYSFHDLVDPVTLPDIKLFTNKLEHSHAVGGCRKINLDPGLVNYNHLLLASTKNSGHRVPLRDGIYAEVTLLFQRGAFRELIWTYRDFRSDKYKNIVAEVRELYRLRMNAER